MRCAVRWGGMPGRSMGIFGSRRLEASSRTHRPSSAVRNVSCMEPQHSVQIIVYVHQIDVHGRV